MAEKRTYAERRAYLIQAVQRRRRMVRRQAIALKGGRCQVCGYDRCAEALEFHHLDSEVKDFGISSRGYTRSWDKVRQELAKCLLLCANCHREVHAELQLLRETAVGTLGEFREACPGRREADRNGNPERSLPKGRCVGRNVQRLEAEEPLPITPHERPAPYPGDRRAKR
jgi:5-methylcytosine-specific restriction endonuclease McrA